MLLPFLERRADVSERYAVRVKTLSLGSEHGHHLRRQVQYLPELPLLFLKLLFCLFTFLDVGENHIPPNNTALRIARRPTMGAKPVVHPVEAAKTLLMFVRTPRLQTVRQRRRHAREVIGMNRVGGTPAFQFFQALAEVIQNLLIDELELPCQGHRADLGGNAVNEQPEPLLTAVQCLRQFLLIRHVYLGTATLNIAFYSPPSLKSGRAGGAFAQLASRERKQRDSGGD